MYAYIQGKFAYKSPTTVYVETGGVGYLVNISLNTYSQIEKTESGKLFTHLYVKEDQLSLYGFYDEEEKNLFIQLISVSGIGPNTARIILSSMNPLEVRTAIVTENDSAFKKVKGVGPKTAKRVIIDLKDKVKEGTISAAHGIHLSDNPNKALNALIALGFQKQKITKILDSLSNIQALSTEEIIKMALQRLT